MDSDKNENVLPKISADVSEAEQQMDLKDKLAVIDKEIRQLYQFCVQEGFTPAQIEKCAEPLLVVDKTQKRKKWLKRLAWLVVIVAFIAGVYLYDPAYNKVCIYAKLASMKVLPYWDWRYIYEEECAVNNPYHVDDIMTKEECAKCQDLKEVRSFTNTNHKVMSEYLFNQTPVVIKDATQDWRARSEFSIEFLSELIQKSEVLRDSMVCQFESTHQIYDNPLQFLTDAVEGKIEGSYQAYWENCDLGAAKEFRQFYKRPYFLPPMVEAVEGNWIVISSGGTKSLKVSWSAKVSWLAQITGRSRIILRPDPVCEDTCQPLTVFMEPGDSILFTNEIWSISFKPLGDEPVIAVGAGGSTF